MTVSPRFAVPVAALLALALVPTIIHSYVGVRVDDRARASAIGEKLGGWASTPTARRTPWVRNNFSTEDWIERTYVVDGTQVSLFAARSYDAKRLYHHPELAILRGTQTTPAGVTTAGQRPDIPLHVLETRRGDQPGTAVYAMAYDGRYIDNPLLFQMRASVELLVTGRKPMTLFMASDLAGRPKSLEQAPATRLLLAAIEDFERQSAVVSPQ